MLYKYYTFNVALDGKCIGSRVVRVLFYESPFTAMRIAMDNVSEYVAIVDFRKL